MKEVFFKIFSVKNLNILIVIFVIIILILLGIILFDSDDK